MWSLGCVIAELFLGWPLYPGALEYDQVIFHPHTLYCIKCLDIMKETKGSWCNRVQNNYIFHRLQRLSNV